LNIFNQIERFQIVDSLNIFESLKVDLLNEKECNYDKFYKINFKKKLKPFTQSLAYEIISIPKIIREARCIELYKKLLQIFISKGGNYFSHENLQIFKNQIEEEQIHSNLEGKNLLIKTSLIT
jgi:hypothetical protein